VVVDVETEESWIALKGRELRSLFASKEKDKFD
jgi:hypothetical protein